MAGDDPAVVLEGVEFAYTPGVPVLRGIDEVITQGEFVTIIGQNGSGKSTLVKQFNGLLTPDVGEVRVFDGTGTGFDTAEHSMKELARVVGLVFQNPDDQIFHTNVHDEIAYGLRNIGIEPEERERRINSIVEDVGLPGSTDINPFSLSRGQRQRLAIASVLAMEPQVIVVDEPTTGQDRKEAIRIMDILRWYNERGHTVITITHDIALAAAYTDRVIALKDGRIVADGPPRRVFLEEENLEETNVRPPQITQLGLRLKEHGFDGVLDEMWLTTEDATTDVLAYLGRAAIGRSSISEGGPQD